VTDAPLMSAVLHGMTVDCADPVRVARFWCSLLGGELGEDADLPGWRRVLLTEPSLVLSFQPVPESKVCKVRLHLDVTVGEIEDGMAEVARLGGSFTGERHDYPGSGVVVVMADPEGNEFCLIQFE
jgi:predicted enzyme related to lactoylglutathione lyase